MEGTEAGTATAWGDSLEEHRASLLVHCYRFLGSYHDAEEATQETFLRAWRARESFRGDASVRTWLHRIGTRVCLDLIDKRQRRITPVQLVEPSDPSQPPAPPMLDVAWLEPIPTAVAASAQVDPESAYTLAESVKLAFVAALQALPPRQRAVLILRDVLGWSAIETAGTLDATVGSVNSALHRAREQVRAAYHAEGIEAFPGSEPDDPMTERFISAYVDAWQRDDVSALVEALKSDVRLAMPPVPSWYRGRDEVVSFLRRWVLPQGRLRLERTSANDQPALVMWPDPSAPDGEPVGVQVLTVGPEGIEAIDSFMTPGAADPFI